MRRRGGIGALVALVAMLALAFPVAAQEAAGRPQRIVSLNLCTDQLLVALVERERIASVSFLAADADLSTVAAQARGLPVNRGRVEEILATDPDLVLAHAFAARQTVAMLRRLGHRVVEIDLPSDLAEVRAQIATVAGAVGEPARGAAMVAGIDARLAALPRPAAGARPVAAIYEPNGYAFGHHSLADAILQAAGFDNLAARLGVGGYARLGLESLLADPPDMLVVDETAGDRRSLAQQFLDHPALRQGFAASSRIVVPRRLWLCGGPAVADAAAMLAEARLQRFPAGDR